MPKALSLFMIVCMPLISVAQSDETYKVCDDRVFTKVEILPEFKNGKAAFEDSLTRYLKKKNALPKKGNVTFSFIVTGQSKVMDLKKEEGDIPFEAVVEEALTSIPNMWNPAIQNTHIVCAYITLYIDFAGNRPDARILVNEHDL